jgi:hypothetical protein
MYQFSPQDITQRANKREGQTAEGCQGYQGPRHPITLRVQRIQAY